MYREISDPLEDRQWGFKVVEPAAPARQHHLPPSLMSTRSVITRDGCEAKYVVQECDKLEYFYT